MLDTRRRNHRRRIQIRRQCHAGQRGVAAVAGAIDADALRISDAFLDQPVDAVGDVVLHRPAPLAERRFPELAAEAGGAAGVGLEHGVAAVDQKLHLGIEAPGVASPRPAVRVHDHGQVLGRAAERQGQIAIDGQAIARRVLHRLHVCHLVLRQPGDHLAQAHQGVGLAVVHVAHACGAAGRCRHHHADFIARATLDAETVAGQARLQALEHAPRLGLEEVAVGAPGFELGGGQGLARASR